MMVTTLSAAFKVLIESTALYGGEDGGSYISPAAVDRLSSRLDIDDLHFSNRSNLLFLFHGRDYE